MINTAEPDLGYKEWCSWGLWSTWDNQEKRRQQSLPNGLLKARQHNQTITLLRMRVYITPKASHLLKTVVRLLKASRITVCAWSMAWTKKNAGLSIASWPVSALGIRWHKKYEQKGRFTKCWGSGWYLIALRLLSPYFALGSHKLQVLSTCKHLLWRCLFTGHGRKYL